MIGIFVLIFFTQSSVNRVPVNINSFSKLLTKNQIRDLGSDSEYFESAFSLSINVTDGLDRTYACLMSVLRLMWIRIRCSILRSKD